MATLLRNNLWMFMYEFFGRSWEFYVPRFIFRKTLYKVGKWKIASCDELI